MRDTIAHLCCIYSLTLNTIIRSCMDTVQVTPKPATSFTANILSIAATAPRFSYLPVSNPALSSSALRRGINSTQQTAGMSSGLGAGGLATASTSGRSFDVLDQTGNYSFANISVGRVISAASAEQRAAQSAESTPFQVSTSATCCAHKVGSCL